MALNDHFLPRGWSWNLLSTHYMFAPFWKAAIAGDIDNGKKQQKKHQMVPYSLSDVIQISRSPKIQNWFEKMLWKLLVNLPWSACWSVLGQDAELLLLMCWSAPCVAATAISVGMCVSCFGQKRLLNALKCRFKSPFWSWNLVTAHTPSNSVCTLLYTGCFLW